MSSRLTSHAGLLNYATRQQIPLAVSLELTHHCNYRCRHCYIADFHAPDLLSTERVFELLGELADMGTLWLTLTGGEVFLRKDWLTIARHARGLGFSLRIFSNGYLIDDQRADQLAELGCAVEITLYSLTPEIFDTITCRRGTFQRTLVGIERLLERGIELELKTPVLTLNRHCIDDVATYARRIGATFRADPNILPRRDGNLAPLALAVDKRDLLPVVNDSYTGCWSPDEGRAGDDSLPLCGAATRTASIDSAGNVHACTIMPGAGGNLREQSFRDVWENSAWFEEIRRIRRADLAVCGSCKKSSYCGRCQALALNEDGSLYGPSSRACHHAAVIDSGLERADRPATIPVRIVA